MVGTHQGRDLHEQASSIRFVQNSCKCRLESAIISAVCLVLSFCVKEKANVDKRNVLPSPRLFCCCCFLVFFGGGGGYPFGGRSKKPKGTTILNLPYPDHPKKVVTGTQRNKFQIACASCKSWIAPAQLSSANKKRKARELGLRAKQRFGFCGLSGEKPAPFGGKKLAFRLDVTHTRARPKIRVDGRGPFFPRFGGEIQ